MMKNAALVCGSTRGIGLALLKSLARSDQYKQVFATYRSQEGLATIEALHGTTPTPIVPLPLDVNNESSIHEMTLALSSKTPALDLCINAIGVLSGDNSGPERRLEDVQAAAVLQALQTNAIASLLITKGLKESLMASPSPVFVGLSAKVGSIEDNHLGGWYSYRASKAALNMILKNLAIELKRLNRHTVVMAIHPGTTETDLTRPFLESAKKKYTIHSADETAENILKLVNQAASKTHNGRFWSWDGSEIPW